MKILKTLLMSLPFIFMGGALHANELDDSTTTNQSVISKGEDISSGGGGTRRVLKDVNTRKTWEGGKTNNVTTPPWAGRSWQRNDYTYFEVRWPRIYKCTYRAGKGTSCGVFGGDLRTSAAMSYVDGVSFEYGCRTSMYAQTTCNTGTARWIK